MQALVERRPGRGMSGRNKTVSRINEFHELQQIRLDRDRVTVANPESV
jgi:hypothetical protein